MIVVLDYGLGNPAAVLNMIRKVGGDGTLWSLCDDFSKATSFILPGVGSFDECISSLRNWDGIERLTDEVLIRRKLFLGICVGMQILFESSEEGDKSGLGWLPGHVKKFNFQSENFSRKLKVPHMGWNSVSINVENKLLRSEETDPRFYFVHSYYAVCADEKHVIATCNHGLQFVCAVNSANLWGVQFHPEKSHRFGMKFISNFVELSRDA